MLITDHFVYIHFPKTGGTFVETMLCRLYEARGYRVDTVVEGQRPPLKQRVRTALSRRPAVTMLYQFLPIGRRHPTHHGWASLIPPEHRDKPILTTVRNPYDRIVSQFEYRNWLDGGSARDRVDAVKPHYPHYPNITFAEYVEISNMIWGEPHTLKLPAGDRLGFQTRQFIRVFFRDPLRVLPEIDRQYLLDKRYVQDLTPNISFTFTHDLNRTLCDFLLTVGFTQAELAFILDHEKVLPRKGGRSDDQAWEKYYTPELKAQVRHRERMLFELFPVFEVP